MSRVIAALLLAALAAAPAPGAVRAEGAVRMASDKAIVSLPLRPPLETATASFADVLLHLIGTPGSESLGVSVRATVTPKGEFTGKEKAVLYFYATCDDEPPARSGGVLVATLELADLAEGREAQTIVTTGTASSLVSLANVACAKLGVVCKNCTPAPPAAYGIRRLDPTLDPAVQDIRVDDASLTLVGEASAKNFGVAVRATVLPTVALAGGEKLVIRLYTACDSTERPGSGATNVGTIELGSLRTGSDRQRLAATKDVTAFVPMQDIACAVIDME